MNPEHDGQMPEIDPRELQATSHALGELTPEECDELAASLASDAAAKRACAETKVIADALRDAHDASGLPAASPELLAAIESSLSSTHPEGKTVTTKPQPESFEKKSRRRFSRLEIVLSLAVVLLGACVVLLGAREAGIRKLADIRIVVDDSKSTSADDGELDQRRLPHGGFYVEDGTKDSESSNGTPLVYWNSARVETVNGQPRARTYTRNLEGESRANDIDRDGVGDKGYVELPASDLAARESARTISEYDRLTRNSPGPQVNDYALQGQGQGRGQGQGSGANPPWVTEDYRRWGSRIEGKAITPRPTGEQIDATRSIHKELGVGWVGGRVHGEGRGGDQHSRIYENAFKTVEQDPLSTFSIDVDTASYSKMRQHILEYGRLPPPDAIRIEELINYFPYDYNEPMDEHPFAAHMEVAQCPWQPEHRLARIAIKGKEMKPDARPASNLVFLVDVSGSMNEANKLPLVVRGLQMLTRELNQNDRVAIVVYAGAAGLVLPSTTGDEKETILAALEKLQAGGSTAGAEGIKLAYQTAEENFITAGVNRVILCTDGDFNVGVSDTGGLVRLAEKQAKKNIFLSILGFGIGNLNDDMLEQVSGKANGMYAFIDTENEARKVLVEQMSGTLVTIAKDVKIQVEFNPAKVAAYRLIGYENRILAAEDFNDDKKDAGEIGAGHTVTALYEIVPVVAKEKPEIPAVDELKYQRPSELTDAAESEELLTLKLRYKSPEGDKSTLLSEPVKDNTQRFGKVSDDFKFAAAVASFGMLLRGSEYAGDATLDAVLEIATDGAKHDEWGYRNEFLEIVKRATELKK